MFKDPIIAELVRDIITTISVIILYRVLRFLRKFENKVSQDLETIKTSLPPPNDDTPVDYPPRNKQ